MNVNDTSTDFTVEHYSRPEVKAIIQSKAAAGDAFKCGNGDFSTWYKYNEDGSRQLFNLCNDDDYNKVILHHRTLYWSLNFFEHAAYTRKQLIPKEDTEQEEKLGSPEETTDYTLGADIDHADGTDIHSPDVKKAVEDMAQFYSDALRQYIPNSVYVAYSGGGIYVYVHHRLWSSMLQETKDKDYTQFILRETFNMWLCAKQEEFFLLNPEHIDKCKCDVLNNRKRVFKSILSIHKRLPYAVIPLNPKNIVINFERAKLPLSDDVIAEARNWYIAFDTFEGECPLLTVLKPFTEEAIGKYKKYGTPANIEDITAQAVNRDGFPPCIRRILDTDSMTVGKTRAISLLASFLYHAGWNKLTAETLFNDVARKLHANTSNIFPSYFGVMHCPNCATIKSHGGGFPLPGMKDLDICHPDSICKKIKSPAKYLLKNNQKKPKEDISYPSIVEDLIADGYYRTDLGNANRLVDMFGDRLRFCEGLNSWFVWDGRRWENLPPKCTGKVMQYARSVAKRLLDEAFEEEDAEKRDAKLFFALKRQSRSGLANMIAVAQSDKRIAIDADLFDADPWILNVQNGILDLKSGKLLLHNPNAYCSRISTVVFDPDAKHPVWTKFINRIFQNNDRILEYCQRRAGYIMTGDTREEDFEEHYGGGGNGKSKYALGIITVMGEYHTKANVETIQASNDTKGGSSASPDVVDLKGARLVTVSEPDKGTVLNESRIKDWTGRDPIKARPLYCPPIEFMPIFKLWIYTNHKIVITSQNRAIWRRIKFLPFEVSIPEEEIDKELDYKIKSEASGILNWMLEGCLKWQKDGLRTPPEMLQAVADYKEEMDVFSDFFSLCVLDKMSEVYAQDLYTVYQAWCSIREYNPFSQKKFYAAMEERGLKKLPKDKYGIKLLGVTLVDAVKQHFDYVKSNAGKAKGDAVTLVTQFLVTFGIPPCQGSKSCETASFPSLRHQIEERITIFSKKYGLINSSQMNSFVKDNIKPLFPDQKEEDLIDIVSRILCTMESEDVAKNNEVEPQQNLRHSPSSCITDTSDSVTIKNNKDTTIIYSRNGIIKNHTIQPVSTCATEKSGYKQSEEKQANNVTESQMTNKTIAGIPKDVRIGGDDL